MKRIYLFLTISAIFTAAIWGLIFIKVRGAFLEADFFDVGQGDSILIKMPYGQTLLVDGGPDNKILEKIGRYLPPLAKRIDIVILTHPHADHVTGLVEVLKRYDIGLVILGGANIKTDVYGEFLKTLKDKGTTIMIAKSGEALHFGDGIEFDILSPLSDMLGIFDKRNEGFGKAGNDINDSSVVGKLFFKNFSVLLMGDATSKIENNLLAYGSGLKSDVLKVGHHGSKYSSSSEFLSYVKPKASIIEVGAHNRYGHPTQATLERLKNLNISIFRTDKDGDIKILSDGVATNIYKEKSP